jgi:hypothetical protein
MVDGRGMMEDGKCFMSLDFKKIYTSIKLTAQQNLNKQN